MARERVYQVVRRRPITRMRLVSNTPNYWICNEPSVPRQSGPGRATPGLYSNDAMPRNIAKRGTFGSPSDRLLASQENSAISIHQASMG
jgi:hypothetical protein